MYDISKLRVKFCFTRKTLHKRHNVRHETSKTEISVYESCDQKKQTKEILSNTNNISQHNYLCMIKNNVCLYKMVQ
jgi:hypothetical protein